MLLYPAGIKAEGTSMQNQATLSPLGKGRHLSRQTIIVPRLSLRDMIVTWWWHFSFGEQLTKQSYEPPWWHKEFMSEKGFERELSIMRPEWRERFYYDAADDFDHIREVVWVTLVFRNYRECPFLPRRGIVRTGMHASLSARGTIMLVPQAP